jgi:hypothetical protein
MKPVSQTLAVSTGPVSRIQLPNLSFFLQPHLLLLPTRLLKQLCVGFQNFVATHSFKAKFKQFAPLPPPLQRATSFT